MIVLVTGVPGSGKTAKVVDLLAFTDQFKDRPLFCMGIPELKLEHQPVPPVAEWVEFRQSPEDPSVSLPYFTFPPKSVIVIDEAQRIFRPRPVGSKVPAEVQAFETHRHTGVDFILVTQSPNLLDPNIRKLISKHIHIRVTAIARYAHEWAECGDPESRASRDLSARTKYKPPKRVFDLYKSAEVHTKIKVKLPWYYYVFAVALLLFVGIGYKVYSTIKSKTDGATLPGAPGSVQPGQNNGQMKAGPITVAAYVDSFKPRVEGLLHTAPIYDEITKPKDAPWPAACIRSARTCKCWDQQGNAYKTTEQVCGQIVANGIFKPHADRERNELQRTEKTVTAKGPVVGDAERPRGFHMAAGPIPAPQ